MSTKISQLPLATSPVAPDVVLPVVQDGVTKKASIDQLGFLQSGTGATTRIIQNKLRDTVSVKDFGAVGDGVADDAAAIQSAINSGNSVVYFPAGVYIIGTTVNLVTGTILVGDSGAVLKLKAQSWAAANGLMFSAVLVTDVKFKSLTLDGNKGNVGTTRSPLNVIFRAQRVSFEDCTFQNAEGICLNNSSDIDNYEVKNCQFLSCGGNPDNTDGYRKQAITFSSDSVRRSQNIRITGCYFHRQGLDCISLADCDNVLISDNRSFESYTLVYSNPAPYTTTNLVIADNVVNVCSEFGAGTAVAPAAVDLPSVNGLALTGNLFSEIDACAIGLFEGTTNAVVSGNTIINPMRGGGSSFVSGIFIGGVAGEDALSNIKVCGNLIVDTAVTPLMNYGVTVKSDTTGVLIQDNVVKNPLTARYGAYSTNPFLANISAFTSTSQVSSSCRILDIDLQTNTEIIYGDVQIKDGTLNMQAYGNYADDAAAATAGVPVDGVYRTGSVLKVRVS